MRVIGVDLAWAEQNRTGVCAVNDGRVVASASVRSDDDIVQWVARYGDDEVVVAFDAPLIVPNDDGCRGCERVIGSVWGRAHASCYPANRSKPWFADGGRAWRLARRLGLATDPTAIRRRPARVAIEVYPHTAFVSLFALATVLKYKAGRCSTRGDRKPRSVTDRRGEFQRMVGFLVTLRQRRPVLDVATASEWSRLLADIEGASSGAALDLVEDELDAYMCAYVGLQYAARRGPHECAVIGDERSGYVITPVDEARWPAVQRAAIKYGVAVN